MIFSQRNCLSPVATAVPVGAELLTQEVRICLWNIFFSRVFSRVTCTRDGQVAQDYHVFISVWKHFYKLPLDEYERDMTERKAWYRDQFEALQWFKLFDLIEYVAQKMANDSQSFVDDINALFSEIQAPYRMNRSYILPFSSDSNIAAVNKIHGQLILQTGLEETRRLFFDALIKFADRTQELSHEAICCAIEALNTICTTLDVDNLPLTQPSQQLVKVVRTMKPKKTNPSEVHGRHEAEFLFTTVAATLELIAAAAVACGRLSPLEQTILKNSAINLWD